MRKVRVLPVHDEWGRGCCSATLFYGAVLDAKTARVQVLAQNIGCTPAWSRFKVVE
jgi:hypothetical protein